MIDLDDILKDDSLFDGLEVDTSLFSNKRYQATIQERAKSTSSQRKALKTNQSFFNDLFANVREDIASGHRQIRNITETEISQKSPIKQGNFYIDNGVMLYVDKIYHPETMEEVSESTNRHYKVHTVYENGTENDIWLLSLVSSLYDKKRSGRLITENLSDLVLMGQETMTTGYIYIVTYAGDDERFKNLDNLYKIGVAKDIKQRLSHTENQSTYLFAPVSLVQSFEIQNIDAMKMESYLHHVLADKRIELTTISPQGKEISIREWFIVTLEEVQQIITKLIIDLQS